jgi:hypothetical protein
MRQIEGVERGVNHLFLRRRRRTLFRTTTKPKRRPKKKTSSNNATRWPWFEIENPTRFMDTTEEICQETNTKITKTKRRERSNSPRLSSA